MSLARRRNNNKGAGLINTLINKLPIELHVPGYQYCGPGTNLKKRLARGDKGINLLDSACRDHDIAYDQSNSIADRNKADYILEQRAWDRFKSKDSSLKEKAVAWGVTTAMKAKRKIGGGCGFKTAIKAAKNTMKKNIGEKNLTKLTKKCVAVARKTFKIKKTKIPRTITIPKKGGVLPLIPIFAGLSALGALTGGVANVVKVANEFNRNAPSHLGKGLYLTPYKGNSYKIGSGEKKLISTLPSRALYDFELIKIARLMKIPHFIGVELACDIFPPLEVENTAQICLLSLQTNNSIPNIEPGCNTIAFRNLINNNEYVIIPTGTYELDQLESIIQKMMPEYISFFELKANSTTLKCSISCSHDVDLSVGNSIAKLLGFRNVLYTTGATHESENIVNIMKINCIKVECNLITGSFSDYVDECKITQMNYHSFSPYSNMSLSNNDEIRISVLNMDSYTLPCESYIYIEGKVNKPSDAAGDVRFSNNGLAFLFSEMRYEINGIEIQKLKSPGVSSCLKAYCSYTPNDLNALENAAWDSAMDSEDNKNFMSNNVFTGCIPLKHLFGFCEDYKKILLNCNQQLILNRASTDLDAIHVVGAGATAVVDKNKKITIELTKVLWKMPIIKVSDKEKLRLLKVIDSHRTLSCAFRTWDLCEYPILPRNTSHSWTVKSSIDAGRFDHCQLKNLKVHLNSEVILYKAYTDFQKSYYERDYSEPLLSKHIFQNYVPIVVVDLSRQNDNVKSSTVDLRIEFETDTVIPEKTAAYCLILHDQIITYNPFSGDVRKLISSSDIKDVFGIIVSYSVKVKLYLGALGGELTAELPFLVMHSKPEKKTSHTSS
ncbi:hypothetical protein QTP88_007181 [Uroleucon formosanum]